MTRILAIDPGPFQSGYVMFDAEGRKALAAGIFPNRDLLMYMRNVAPQKLAIEMIASYGMPVGAEVFETCVWIGRFAHLWESDPESTPVQFVFRKDVKLHLCGTSKAKDANIRQALIDKLGPVGTKNNKGPLYGVKSHCWAALAVAITALEQGENHVGR